MTERKARASGTGRKAKALRTLCERLTGHGDGSVGGEEEADAVRLAGVEEVGEGSELGFDGGAVACEVEVRGGGLQTIEVERQALIVLVEEDGFDELEGLVGAG
jgi:hypothetical protein